MHDYIDPRIAIPLAIILWGILLVMIIIGLRRDKVARDKLLREAGYIRIPRSARIKRGQTPPKITHPTPGGATAPRPILHKVVVEHLDKDLA